MVSSALKPKRYASIMWSVSLSTKTLKPEIDSLSRREEYVTNYCNQQYRNELAKQFINSLFILFFPLSFSSILHFQQYHYFQYCYHHCEDACSTIHPSIYFVSHTQCRHHTDFYAFSIVLFPWKKVSSIIFFLSSFDNFLSILYFGRCFLAISAFS